MFRCSSAEQETCNVYKHLCQEETDDKSFMKAKKSQLIIVKKNLKPFFAMAVLENFSGTYFCKISLLFFAKTL